MHKLDLWFFFFSYFLHDLQGPTTAHKTFTQSRHVAGICSSRGVDEYSEAKLPPRPWETWHTHTHTHTTTTTKDPHCLSLQVSLSLSQAQSLPPSLDVVEYVQHSTGVTHSDLWKPPPPLPCDQGGRKSSCAYTRGKGQIITGSLLLDILEN